VAKASAKKKRQAVVLPRFRFQYAAKFLCTSNLPGTSQTSTAVLPGVYQTAVNIHNPGEVDARIRMKLAVRSGEISPFKSAALKPDQATCIDCAQVQDFGLHLIHGFEGFLVVESTASLDVVAVYTAGGRGAEVASLDVEHVPERKLG